MPLIAAMDQPNLQTPKNYQLFFIPSSAHSIVAFCPFTRVAARGDSTLSSLQNWLLLARVQFPQGRFSFPKALLPRKVYRGGEPCSCVFSSRQREQRHQQHADANGGGDDDVTGGGDKRSETTEQAANSNDGETAAIGARGAVAAGVAERSRLSCSGEDTVIFDFQSYSVLLQPEHLYSTTGPSLMLLSELSNINGIELPSMFSDEVIQSTPLMEV